MKYTIALAAATLAVGGMIGLKSLDVSALTQNQQFRNGYERSTDARPGDGRGAGRQSSLEMRAKVLGMTADELQTALETKTMSQLAVEKGLTEDTFRTKMQEAATQRWQERGLSQAEIEKRLAEREQRHAENAADHEFGSGEGMQHRQYRGQ